MKRRTSTSRRSRTSEPSLKKLARPIGRCPTGIDGFDDITSGGLPLGRVTLAFGGYEYLRRRRELEAADAEAKIRIESINREISLRDVDRQLLERRDSTFRQQQASDVTEAKRRRGADVEAPTTRMNQHGRRQG